MFPSQLGSVLLTFVFFVLSVWLLLRFIFYQMAKKDKHPFTLREVGKIKAHLRGGDLVEFLWKAKGKKLVKTLDDPRNKYQFESLAPGEIDRNSRATWWELFFGVYWYGWPSNEILRDKFSYDRHVREDDPTEKRRGYEREEDIMHRTSVTNYLAVQKAYPLLIRNAELPGGLRITLRGSFTVQVYDPYAAMILIGLPDWYLKVRNAIEGIITNTLRDVPIETFMQISDKVGKPATEKDGEILSFLEKAIIDSMKLTTSVKFSTGMEVISFDYRNFDVIKGEEQKAVEAGKLAELNARKGIEEAKGRKTQTILDAQARAEAITLEAEAQAKANRLIGQTDADILTLKRTALGDSPAATAYAVAEQQQKALVATKVGTLVWQNGDKKVPGLMLPPTVPAPAPSTPPSASKPAAESNPPATVGV